VTDITFVEALTVVLAISSWGEGEKPIRKVTIPNTGKWRIEVKAGKPTETETGKS
jgi:hypothetical protein